MEIRGSPPVCGSSNLMGVRDVPEYCSHWKEPNIPKILFSEIKHVGGVGFVKKFFLFVLFIFAWTKLSQNRFSISDYGIKKRQAYSTCLLSSSLLHLPDTTQQEYTVNTIILTIEQIAIIIISYLTPHNNSLFHNIDKRNYTEPPCIHKAGLPQSLSTQLSLLVYPALILQKQ